MIDFGFAIQTKGRATTVCGTPAYMAPELLLPREKNEQVSYNQSVDMWSLGILICDMMGGFTPFDTGLNSPLAIYQNIINGDMRLPKCLGRVGTDLVVRLL